MDEIKKLRFELANVKAANPLAKLAPAERALDAVVAAVAALDARVTKIEREIYHGDEF